MKILNKEKDSIELYIENMDDLWHLHHIIRIGDKVHGRTFRAADKDELALRAKKLEKRAVFLDIEVEKIEFHSFSNVLRVNGVVVDGEFAGSSHTLNLKSGDKIKILKVLEEHELGRIKEAVNSANKHRAIFIAMDEEETLIARLHAQGLEEVARVYSYRSGKQYAGQYAGNWDERGYHGRILAAISTMKEGPVIIIGPGMAKNRFHNYAQSKEKLNKSIVVDSAHRGELGIKEILKRKIVDQIDAEFRAAEEFRDVDELLKAIARNEPCTYGLKECFKAVEAGAGKVLLVLDDMVRDNEVEKLMDIAGNMGVRIMLINSESEAGKVLNSLGGIGALLRYRIEILK